MLVSRLAFAECFLDLDEITINSADMDIDEVNDNDRAGGMLSASRVIQNMNEKNEDKI